MPEGTTADATKTEPAKIETPPTDAKPSETPTETPTEKPVEKPADGGGDKSAPKDGKAFIADFGVDGAVWFAEGKSHAEAAQLFAKKLRDDNDALKKQVTEFTAKLGKSSGEADPLSFTEHTANKKTDKAAVNIGSPGVATFAAHLDEKNFAPKQPG